MTTYPKRDRERAVEALMTIAANRLARFHPRPWDLLDVRHGPVKDIASAAYGEANPDERWRQDLATAHTYAAAASLLYAGWSPTPPKRARGRGRAP